MRATRGGLGGRHPPRVRCTTGCGHPRGTLPKQPGGPRGRTRARVRVRVRVGV